MGAVVLVVAVFFVMIAYKSGSVSTSDSVYKLRARFEKVDGISPGSDVRVGGIKIGSVLSESLDTKTYRPELVIGIKEEVRFPKDSSAEIVSDGLLGNKYVSLVPGADEEMLKNNDLVEFTQSSVNIEALISKFMFSGGDKDKKGSGKGE